VVVCRANIETILEVDVAVPILWAGVDARKLDHHCAAIDSTGLHVLSRRVRNDEDTLTNLIDDVIALADGGCVQRAIDLNAGGAALLVTLGHMTSS
jgi:hypothetical protein